MGMWAVAHPFLSFPFLTFAHDTSLWVPAPLGCSKVRVWDDDGIMLVWLSETTNSGSLHHVGRE